MSQPNLQAQRQETLLVPLLCSCHRTPLSVEQKGGLWRYATHSPMISAPSRG